MTDEEIRTEDGKLNPRLRKILLDATLKNIRENAPIDFSLSVMEILIEADYIISGMGIKHYDSWTEGEKRAIRAEWVLAYIEYYGIDEEIEDHYYRALIDGDKVRPIP